MLNNRQNGRRRGRSNRPNNGGGPRGNESRIDSRARGNAPQMLEKYKNLARDAQLSGDRVMTEYYLQFADHYFRIVAESRARFEEQRRQRDDWQEGDDEGEEMDARSGYDGSDEDGEDSQPRQRQPRNEYRENGNRDNGNRDGQRDGNRDNRDRDGNRETNRDGNRDAQRDDSGQRREPRRNERNDRSRAPRNRNQEGQGQFGLEGERDENMAHEPVIDVAVLPPALGVIADAIPDIDDEPAPTPKRRGRPRKVVSEEAPAES